MAVNYEKLNILIDGNYIANADSLIETIKDLKYDFNTHEYLDLMANNLRYSTLTNKALLEHTINLKLFEFINIKNREEEKPQQVSINGADYNYLLTKQNVYKEKLSPLELERLNMYIEVLLKKEAGHTLTPEEEEYLTSYVSPLLAVHNTSSTQETPGLDERTARQLKEYLDNRESLHNKYRPPVPTLMKKNQDKEFSNGIANVVILLSIGIVAIFTLMIFTLAK